MMNPTLLSARAQPQMGNVAQNGNAAQVGNMTSQSHYNVSQWGNFFNVGYGTSKSLLGLH